MSEAERDKLIAQGVEKSTIAAYDGQVLSAITEQNPTLKNALFADVAARLNHHQARLAQSESQKLLYQPIANLGQHIKPPHFIDDTATLYEATMAMNQFDIKHILVKSQTRMSEAERDKLIAQGVEKSTIAAY
ncbi:hypothetical protein, partial [Cronobacter sakazakii]|uniref:hypothetical protein n=1 Tax=Cronobacter sakazakii TaxID=28141 RepID=UPI0018F86528